MSRWQVLVISPDISEHLRPHGHKGLGEPRGKESSQQTRLGVGVVQDTGRDLRKWGDMQSDAKLRKICSKRALARAWACIYLPSFPSHSLMYLRSPQSITPWSSHALFTLQKEQRSSTSEITEFPQFQDQLEWYYLSFYSNKCSTEAAWSFL